jgi:hypothetical protein
MFINEILFLHRTGEEISLKTVRFLYNFMENKMYNYVIQLFILKNIKIWCRVKYKIFLLCYMITIVLLFSHGYLLNLLGTCFAVP